MNTNEYKQKLEDSVMEYVAVEDAFKYAKSYTDTIKANEGPFTAEYFKQLKVMKETDLEKIKEKVAKYKRLYVITQEWLDRLQREKEELDAQTNEKLFKYV